LPPFEFSVHLAGIANDPAHAADSKPVEFDDVSVEQVSWASTPKSVECTSVWPERVVVACDSCHPAKGGVEGSPDLAHAAESATFGETRDRIEIAREQNPTVGRVRYQASGGEVHEVICDGFAEIWNTTGSGSSQCRPDDGSRRG